MFLVVRADLGVGQQAVQSAHALAEFSVQHPEAFMEWYQKSNTLAFLSVEDEKELVSLLSSAQLRRITASGFREPDRDDELTAIAIGPAGKRLCRCLPIALKGL